MSKKFERFASYMVTPFEILGWKHAVGWGLVLGFTTGILVSVAIYALWIVK